MYGGDGHIIVVHVWRKGSQIIIVCVWRKWGGQIIMHVWKYGGSLIIIVYIWRKGGQIIIVGGKGEVKLLLCMYGEKVEVSVSVV